MKVKILTIIAALLLSSPAWAKQVDKKVYLPKEAINLSDNGISLVVANGNIPLTALFSDGNGYFVYEKQLNKDSSSAYETKRCVCPYLQRKRQEQAQKEKEQQDAQDKKQTGCGCGATQNKQDKKR
jgi:hypothetical protein